VIRSSDLAEPAAIASALGFPAGALDNLDRLAPGALLPLPVELGKGFAVARLKAYTPAYIPDLETLRPELIRGVKSAEAAALALAEARKVLEGALEGRELPAALRQRLKSLEVTRYAGGEFSGRMDLLAEFYGVRPGAWVAKPLPLEGRVVIARVLKALPPEEAEWAQLSAFYLEDYNLRYQNGLYQIYMARLRERSEIEIKTERLLSRR
jgi:hypothetical protein